MMPYGFMLLRIARHVAFEVDVLPLRDGLRAEGGSELQWNPGGDCMGGKIERINNFSEVGLVLMVYYAFLVCIVLEGMSYI